MASAALCIDPYKDNEGGFGPKIKGLQLGQKMSLLDIVSWGVAQGKLPFTLWLNREFMNNLAIKFEGQGTDFKSFSVDRAEGRYAGLKNFSGKLGDLLSEVDKLGFKKRTFFDDRVLGIYFDGRIHVDDDMRVTRLWFSMSDFGAGEMLPQEFAQAIINAYGIPGLESVGRNEWRYRNFSQGWQVTVDGGHHSSTSGVIVSPIVIQTAFD
ncbi:MAG: hypothetical protein IJT02_07305 [Synergistaceae bacterium]|nr:hypothetical protein [Synergistaceae bacterium]